MDSLRMVLASDFDARRTRKAAPTSRGGCLVCKRKKVKCDEVKPSCSRCRRNHWTCFYTQHAHCPPPSLTNTTVHNQLWTASIDAGTSSSYLLQYFLEHQPHIIDVADIRDILHAAYSDDGIRSSLLALTATYLRINAPDHVHHRTAEHYHRLRTLKSLRDDLAQPHAQLDFAGTIRLLLRAVLVSVLAFPLFDSGHLAPTSATSIVANEWVGWLTLQAGLRHVIRACEPHVARAVEALNRTFVGGDSNAAVSAASSKIVVVPDTWKAFFQPRHPREPNEVGDMRRDGENDASHAASDDESAWRCDPAFDAPLRVLAFLRSLGPDRNPSANLYLAMTFIVKVSPSFRRRLQAQDPRALWLYGYWTALMGRFPQVWWSRARMHRDYALVGAALDAHTTRMEQQRRGPNAALWCEMMVELRRAANPFSGPELQRVSVR